MKRWRTELAAVLVAGGIVPTSAAAEASTASGAATAVAARLRFAVVVPHVLFVGLGPSLQTAAEANGTPGAAALAGHVIVVSLYGGRGPIWVSPANHTHERAGVIVSASASNTPTPALDDNTEPAPTSLATPIKSAADRGVRTVRVARYATRWTYSYANTVMARPEDRTVPVSYTASMP